MRKNGGKRREIRVMKTMKWIAIGMGIALGMLGTAGAVQGQSPNAAAPSLQDLLKTQYKLTRAGSDSGGFKVLEPGTVVVTKNSGIMATANAGPHTPSKDLFGLCNNTLKHGALSVKKGCSTTSLGAKFLPLGDKLYITKFEVKEKDNKISFNLVECDTCNGTSGSMKVEISFEFEPKFLDTAEPGQVTDVIGQVFAPDPEATRAAAAGEVTAPPAGTQPAQAQAAPLAQPAAQPAAKSGPTVKMGDTPQQVIAILGNPIGVKPGGGLVIYQFKDFKVIFVGGRVAGVE
jgi:hypothetical protein